jgi:glycosyltransferase involved in cell wall biosynthesis
LDVTVPIDCDPAVWLDGRNAGRPDGTGVARYVDVIAEALGRVGLPVAYLTDGGPDGRPNGTGRQVRRLINSMRSVYPATTEATGGAICPDIFRTAHVRFRRWGALATVSVPSPPDIMHWTYPLPIRLRGARNVVTIHDVIPLTHPELTGIEPERFRSLLRRLVQSADAVVTTSEAARREIAAQCGAPLARIHNLSQAVGFSAEELRLARLAPPVADPGYFVHVGRVESRKNIRRLVAAHARSGTTRPLVLIGPDGDDRPDYSGDTGAAPVIRLPWCDRATVIRAIQDAHALLFPSLAEGFGLPIVEAMALGTPVLTSRGGATEEIATPDAAILVDARDVADIAAGIRRMDGWDEMSTERQVLRLRGLERAARFSPDVYADRLVQFYRSL